jgi:hypothetical protein
LRAIVSNAHKPHFVLSILVFIFVPIAALFWLGMWADAEDWPLLALAGVTGATGIGAGVAGAVGHRSSTKLFVGYGVLLIVLSALDVMALANTSSSGNPGLVGAAIGGLSLLVHLGSAFFSTVWAIVVIALAIGMRRRRA